MSDAPDSAAAQDSADAPREAVRGLARRSPRYGAFIGTGVAVGVGVGLGLGLGLPGTGVGHRGVVTLLVIMGAVLICGAIAGALAVALDGKDPGPVDDSWVRENLPDVDTLVENPFATPPARPAASTRRKPPQGDA